MADAATIARLRRKIGDTALAFSDTDLDTLLTEADDDFTTALTEGYWELLAQASRFADYTVGLTSEKASQVYAQLKSQYQLLVSGIGSGGGEASNTIQVAPLTYLDTSSDEFGT